MKVRTNMKILFFLTLAITGCMWFLNAAPPPAASAEVQTNEIISAHSWSGFQPLKLSSESIENVRRKAEERLFSTVNKDKTDEINEAVRAKEQKLRKLSRALNKGLQSKDVIVIMGQPDVIQIVQRSTKDRTVSRISRANSVANVPPDTSFVFSYWPRVGVSFNGKNGQGYEVLYLLFDNQGTLERWFWEQPDPVPSGSLRDRMDQKKYWEGEHQNSTAPPFSFHW